MLVQIRAHHDAKWNFDSVFQNNNINKPPLFSLELQDGGYAEMDCACGEEDIFGVLREKWSYNWYVGGVLLGLMGNKTVKFED